ncbi:GTPase-activating protein [Pseudogymnoascus verrucosus]|uniref:GTPase-activating protein GYP5 n=1 Tax=Pseudogymnoascus verrucosus TaxID=342668 RepID=A0A1B8GM89_9PEZI|nr:GTPase-activating protein [Pseudogymnoascus verrucosus]OBT96908.1 GTPase-activating protein [Pseudogymnoascus verrucosus]
MSTPEGDGDTRPEPVVKNTQPESDDSGHETDTFEDADTTPIDHNQALSPTTSTRSLTNSHTAHQNGGSEAPVVPPLEAHPEDDVSPTSSQPRSPAAVTERLSTLSLDNVSLDGEEIAAAAASTDKAETTKPELPPRTSAKAVFEGLQGSLPSVPWGPPPPPPPAKDKPQTVVPPPRKLTGPFSWLSRGSAPPPPTVPRVPSPGNGSGGRRNTTSSIATNNSNPDLMLNKLDEGNESPNGIRNSSRNSLRDRFKLLRMREEAGITSLGEEGEEGTPIETMIGRVSLGQGLTSPTGSEDKALPATPNAAAFNPSLAPGTAAGVTSGPPANEEVDWDLWQSVVYEGPAAVARTSPEELNQAIALGIPSAIRGVVWQVLAQSKNDELESVYRDLLSRGTDQDKDRASISSAGASNTFSNGGKDKDTASSASSVHSDLSGSGLKSPSPTERDPENIAKAQAAALAEKKKKAKDDAASLLKLEKAIKRDLGARTSFSKFAVSAGLQDGLFGVCKAYALFDEGVGYAQGMNFLAMPLLFNLPEEEAFCLLVRLMNQYRLRDLFIQDMPGLHSHLYQFERLLEDLEPALYCHLHRKGVTPHLYATQWFLTLFAYRFPLQLVLRIYDLILSEGLAAILKFGIVLMQKNAATLLGMNDMVALTNFLKDRLFDVYIDASPSPGSILESGFFGSSGASIDKEVYRADTLVLDACAVKITPEMLKTYTSEWEEKTRAEKEREAELELLRSTNASLSLSVRRLEERVQNHDQEHAALATDLVRTKVENEELLDQNESLKGQVEELRGVVERQPAEVEERLKMEMDRLMKRNLEVHEENTRLEEEMGEMEGTLVETKMAFAELNAQHETLQRRWTDLRKALD